MTVNSTSWRKFPVANRDQSFDADDAQVRIGQWAAGSVEKYASAFLWSNPQGPPNAKNSYRLPVVDILNGKPTLIPHAVFTAAAILSGAHGGLEGVVNEKENKELKVVVTEIYDMLQKAYGDSRVKPPWLRGGNKLEEVTASVNTTGWDALPIAELDTPWSATRAREELWKWADGDIRRYRRGFLWHDAGEPEHRNSYRLPVATVHNGELHVVPRAVEAIRASLTASARAAVEIPDSDQDAVAAVADALAARIEAGQFEPSLIADGGPIRPPREWFDDPQFEGPTPLTVTADGRVMGHLAAWGTCHIGRGGKCVTPPHSMMDYKLFHTGTVLTASGEHVRVGKITLGTSHAGPYLGWVPASDHYDNTGFAVAITAAGEDGWGIWVAGSLLPDLPAEKVAELRRSPLSGDWRLFNGNLELVAALAVNTPGFPIVNLTASGEPDTLCAVGVVDMDGSIVASSPPEEPNEAEREALNRLERVEQFVAELRRSARQRRYENLTRGQ